MNKMRAMFMGVAILLIIGCVSTEVVRYTNAQAQTKPQCFPKYQEGETVVFTLSKQQVQVLEAYCQGGIPLYDIRLIQIGYVLPVYQELRQIREFELEYLKSESPLSE